MNLAGGVGTKLLALEGSSCSSPATDIFPAHIYEFQSLTKTGAGEWLLTGQLAATVSNVTVNDGTLTLAGSNSFSGDTHINGGTLAALAAGAFSPNSAYIIAAPGAMDLNGFSQTIASVSNAGVINLNGADAGTELTVTGNYAGNNGRLNFNAKLSDDASDSERLIIGGDTSGETTVTVNNAGGSGAQTLDGIELISVAGASDGEFTQSGRIVAGAYDYTLARGTDANAANWYLNSSTAAPTPEPPGAEPEPSPEPIPDPDPQPGDMVERPEDASYGVNLAAANTLFAAGRDTRSVLTTYIDPITGQQQTTSLWMTNQGGHNRSRDDSGQLRTQSNRYVLQLGGDVGQWSSDGADSFRLGLMAGYGHARSTTDSQVSGYRSRGSVDGYSVGLYGTWYADAAGHDGLYVDGWTQYGWFDNEVNGQDLNEQDYKSKGFTASLETGYAFNIGNNPARNATYYIEPQAQAIWMDVKADDLTEDNGTRVSGNGDGNIQTRLGVKAYMNAYSERDKNKDRLFQPFIEANWIHNSKDFGATLNGVTVSQDGAANIGELKIGVNGQLNKTSTSGAASASRWAIKVTATPPACWG
ncbi:autotransporter outer membrane beta-barrel domain-containing protein [Sodalis ligni]|uniref:autotransporter outer membrane beta-barrel domain-containing protein n=1 Tax=Sodalis ligni TaxID=2697027 RepID=UPI002097821E|nr:autotransporter outer membrane beta-barrel domain-containing protein [Sodalis ligni]